MKNDWLKALQECKPDVEFVPTGWKTMRQISDETNTPLGTTEKKILHLMKNGKVEKKKFKVDLGSVIRPTPHYRLK